MHESDSSEWNKSAESRAKKSKKIKCECGKVYKSQASLTTHIKMHHNGVVYISLIRHPLHRDPKINQLEVDPSNTNINN